MSDFVDQCRREWKRLGVPDPLAEEMAADLASDLKEAEDEGVSTEELLGTSAFDPRSFAASWAAERGIIPLPPSRGTSHKPRVLVAFTAIAAIALIGSALLLLTGQPKLSLVKSSRTAPHLFAPPGAIHTRSVVLSASAATPVEWILLLLAIVALGFAAWLWSNWSRSRQPGAPA